jgi:hypothetical protein
MKLVDLLLFRTAADQQSDRNDFERADRPVDEDRYELGTPLARALL